MFYIIKLCIAFSFKRLIIRPSFFNLSLFLILLNLVISFNSSLDFFAAFQLDLIQFLKYSVFWQFFLVLFSLIFYESSLCPRAFKDSIMPLFFAIILFSFLIIFTILYYAKTKIKKLIFARTVFYNCENFFF